MQALMSALIRSLMSRGGPAAVVHGDLAHVHWDARARRWYRHSDPDRAA